MDENAVDRLAFRLLPSERVLAKARPESRAPLDPAYRAIFVLLAAFGVVTAAFGGVLVVAQIAGAVQTLSTATLMLLFALAVWLAPSFLIASCEYVITDRRVIWRRGPLTRSVDRGAITYGRIHWNRSLSGVGDLELVRAVPFGPFARSQRLKLLNVRSPDRIFALVRDVAPSELGADRDVPLSERLDRDETLLWGGHPEGWLLGWREALTSIAGLAVLAFGVHYGERVFHIVVGLEDLGLAIESWTWLMLVLGVGLTWVILMAVGSALVWHGIVRSRSLGRETEYLLTNRRLLIRRGPTELSLDRKHIVDVAQTRATGGLCNLFLVLDGPGSRALSDSGALGVLVPSRDSVPPILYEVRDGDRLRDLILSRISRPSIPPPARATGHG